jgi:hypothetical protein
MTGLGRKAQPLTIVGFPFSNRDSIYRQFLAQS